MEIDKNIKTNIEGTGDMKMLRNVSTARKKRKKMKDCELSAQIHFPTSGQWWSRLGIHMSQKSQWDEYLDLKVLHEGHMLFMFSKSTDTLLLTIL